jgi:large subunit ribosomal protein L18e
VLILGKPSVRMQAKTNPSTIQLINELKRLAGKNSAPVWKYTAEMMEKPETRWAELNVGKLEDYAKPNSAVLVPGKVLGGGELTKALSVTAFRFSGSAKKKIIDAGGKVVSLMELVESNPKGSGLLLMK